MARMIFVNLPVADVKRATAFYEAIGATRNPTFSSDDTACMVLSDTIHVMLLEHARFQSFSPRPIADAHATAQMLLCLSADSRAHIDAIVDPGAAAGGSADPSPPQDHGFMASRSVADPDGHIWEILWMDPAAMPPAQTVAA